MESCVHRLRDQCHGTQTAAKVWQSGQHRYHEQNGMLLATAPVQRVVRIIGWLRYEDCVTIGRCPELRVAAIVNDAFGVDNVAVVAVARIGLRILRPLQHCEGPWQGGSHSRLEQLQIGQYAALAPVAW